MTNIIWTLIVILFIFWLLGQFVWAAGGLIHILLVLVVIGILYNLFVGRGPRV